MNIYSLTEESTSRNLSIVEHEHPTVRHQSSRIQKAA